MRARLANNVINLFITRGYALVCRTLRGSRPGERRGGRQKGRLNKLSIGRMKAQLAVSVPEFEPYL